MSNTPSIENSIKKGQRPKKLIIQVGRLDKFYRNEIEFSFENESGKADLTSSFLINTNSLKDSRRLIIFPISIILQDHLLGIKNDDFISILETLDMEEYLKEPEAILKEHPQSKDNDILVVSSSGTYKFKGIAYPFNGSLDLITLQIYLHLLSEYTGDELEEIYIDISSGQNIYVTALMNALYRFLPYIKFKRFLCSENEKISGWILNAEPILGTPTHPINIQRSKFSAKAFNTFPYKNYGDYDSLIKRIFSDKDNFKNTELFLKEEYFLLHGALIFGSPLMISLSDKNVLSNLFQNDGLSKIIGQLLNNYKNQNEALLTAIEASQIFAITFALAIGNSIYQYFKEVIENGEIKYLKELNDGGNNFSISNPMVDDAFELLKNTYGQPEPNYKGEIKEYIKIYPMNETPRFFLFRELTEKVKPDYKINNQFNPRNYFAHGGLELNFTELKVEDNCVTIRYKDELIAFNRKCILKYIKK